MLSCLILGDSIAVGISKYKQECSLHAKIGITSKQYINKFGIHEISSKTVAISLGSNDFYEDEDDLRKIRNSIHAEHVYWILPYSRNHKSVKTISKEFSDVVLEIPIISKDKVHPTNNAYKLLSDQIN